MKIGFPSAIIVALFVLAGCDRVAIRPSESLVDAKQLPSLAELGRETIQIFRQSGGDGSDFHMLTYELRPDNTLTVSHVARPVRPNETEEFSRGEERFQLPAATADRLRHMLWRVRPEKLEGIEYQIIPPGCEYQDHDRSEAVVAFIGPGGEDGAFMLPSRLNCDTPAASQARDMMQAVFQMLPQSRVANAFPGLP